MRPRFEPFLRRFEQAVRRSEQYFAHYHPTPEDVCALFASFVPFASEDVRGFDGGQQVYSYPEVLRRSRAQCGDAAAAIIAAARLRKITGALVLEVTPPAAHAWVELDGARLDPYWYAWADEESACGGSDLCTPHVVKVAFQTAAHARTIWLRP